MSRWNQEFTTEELRALAFGMVGVTAKTPRELRELLYDEIVAELDARAKAHAAIHWPPAR